MLIQKGLQITAVINIMENFKLSLLTVKVTYCWSRSVTKTSNFKL